MRHRNRALLGLVVLLVAAFALWLSLRGSDHPDLPVTSDDPGLAALPDGDSTRPAPAPAADSGLDQPVVSPPLPANPESAVDADTDASDAAPGAENPPAKGSEPPPAAPADTPREQPTQKPPVVLDFVQKDIHTVMHYLSLHTGLNVILEGDVSAVLTVMMTIPQYEDEARSREAVIRVMQSLCRANGLEALESGRTLIVRRSSTEITEPLIARGTSEGRWNVNLRDATPWTAITRCGQAMKISVNVPASRGPADAGLRLNLYMREATPGDIMRAIAAECGMEVTEAQEDGKLSFNFQWR